MNQENTHGEEIICSNPVEQLSQDLLSFIAQNVAMNKDVHISLTGGSAGNTIAQTILNNVQIMNNPHLHLWWSDERFLPKGDLERNDSVVDPTLTHRAHIHRVPYADSFSTVDQAAAQYSAELHQNTTTRFCATNTMMDVTVLSIGPDGHVASLFPHHTALTSTLGVIGVTDSPKPPPQRVTWTFPTINASDQVWLIATGEAKSRAVRKLREGSAIENLPAAGVHGKNRTLLYTDIPD